MADVVVTDDLADTVTPHRDKAIVAGTHGVVR
jgi:hypothetical protein